MALVLGVVGLYGVVAYSVSQRTREIGVRMALGAQRGTVYKMVMRQAGWLTLIGLAIGLVCSIGASLADAQAAVWRAGLGCADAGWRGRCAGVASHGGEFSARAASGFGESDGCAAGGVIKISFRDLGADCSFRLFGRLSRLCNLTAEQSHSHCDPVDGLNISN